MKAIRPAAVHLCECGFAIVKLESDEWTHVLVGVAVVDGRAECPVAPVARPVEART